MTHKRLRPFIAGNRKMHSQWPHDQYDIARVFQQTDGLPCDVAFFVPATVLPLLATYNNTWFIGGQDCHHATHGAYTGDISATMLQHAGAKGVIVGHSERRNLHHETSAQIADKIMQAQQCQLTTVLCVGETYDTRTQGSAVDFVTAQLRESLGSHTNPQYLIVAYEPVWAIGTGLVPTSEDILHMHQSLFAVLQSMYGDAAHGIRLLYGGSVNTQNADKIAAVPYVHGALVGGACLQVDSFISIIKNFCATEK